jgi:hypothetical protein
VPDDESRSSFGSARDRCVSRTCASGLCALSQRAVRKIRASLAGAPLLLSRGRAWRPRGDGLHRAKSGSRGDGGLGRGLSMVERRSPRHGSRREWTIGSCNGARGLHERRWRETLRSGVDDEALGERIRLATMTGRPFGSAEFTEELELALHRRLRPQPAGRPRKLCAAGDAVPGNRGMSILSPDFGFRTI